MQTLNFNNYSFRLKNSENKVYIFDAIRKKFLALTPEEWVRQHTIQYLIQELNYPISLINVEKIVKINGMNKRYDIVVFQPNGQIAIIVECKAPEVTVNQQTFDQIARYNFVLQAHYLMVTNGLNHYFCQMDFKNEQYTFLQSLPVYKPLK